MSIEGAGFRVHQPLVHPSLAAGGPSQESTRERISMDVGRQVSACDPACQGLLLNQSSVGGLLFCV